MPVAPTLPVWASVATRLLVCAALAFAAFFVPTPFAAAESHGSHAYTYDSHPDTDASAPDTVDVAWSSEAASRSLANGVVRHVYDRSVIFVAPSGLADDIIRRADANLTGSGETVLGHYADDYIGVAQQRGASYFDIGDAWDGLSDAQRWAANQRVLDTAIANGDRISLATARSNIRYPSALADEIQYLTSNGYTWVDDVTLVPG